VVKTSHDGKTMQIMGENRFSSRQEMEAYLNWCFEHAVVNWIRLSREEGRGWRQIAHGNELASDVVKDSKVRVEVDRVGLTVTRGAEGGADEKFVWDGTERGRTLEELLREIEGQK
jgi:mediator of RNA polymerase II transcription subunit 17